MLFILDMQLVLPLLISLLIPLPLFSSVSLLLFFFFPQLAFSILNRAFLIFLFQYVLFQQLPSTFSPLPFVDRGSVGQEPLLWPQLPTLLAVWPTI